MALIKKLKAYVNFWINSASLWYEYIQDCREYNRWQYRNPNVLTRDAAESRILRQAHILEKGMSLSKPRDGFGAGKAWELIRYINEYFQAGFSADEGGSVNIAIGVLDAYLMFHENQGTFLREIRDAVEKIHEMYSGTVLDCGTRNISKEMLMQQTQGKFPEFFSSRHSMRQFSNQPVYIEEIEEAVRIAMYAPSACNRQSCKVYYYHDEKINNSLGELISGNTGFENEIQNYLVVTSNISAYYDAFERNQLYIDGGIFALALAESLHYCGIASCILQNGEYKKKNKQIKAVCENIPENEKIVAFIAVGHYKDNVTYAASLRKNMTEVLKER